MEELLSKIEKTDWEGVTDSMNRYGYAILPGLLSDAQCAQLQQSYNTAALYRKKVIMERYRFGKGEYKYFTYPLPQLIQQLRSDLYARLVPIANQWSRVLNLEIQYPPDHGALLEKCHEHGQRLATVLSLKYGPGGFNTLHQDLYGEVYFPMQVVLMLAQPGRDYSGGEFVLTKQIPRAQSSVKVLLPQKGDAIIFTTQFKPEKGTKGYYRIHIKHGVSEILTGQRNTLGIIFHDSIS